MEDDQAATQLGMTWIFTFGAPVNRKIKPQGEALLFQGESVETRGSRMVHPSSLV